MRIYETTNEINYFGGDLHGNFGGVLNVINSYDLKDCNIIICGDIGIGFEREGYYTNIFNKWQERLEKRNIHVYMFRGNHDDPSYFDGKHFTEYANVHVIPDYSVIITPIVEILCVGGATSIDRTWRLGRMHNSAMDYMCRHHCTVDEALQNTPKTYWDNEAMVFNKSELDALNELKICIDVVCTHTAPSNCLPIGKGSIQDWLAKDKDLNEDLDNERKTCDELRDYLLELGHEFKHWYYGHFHDQHVDRIDGVLYQMLGHCQSNGKWPIQELFFTENDEYESE